MEPAGPELEERRDRNILRIESDKVLHFRGFRDGNRVS